MPTPSKYNAAYTGENLNRIAFPLGGIGAGMVCLEGTGAISHVSLRHRPEVFNEPMMFAALSIKGVDTARVIEGPVPHWKAFGSPGAGNGASGRNYGLPRFRKVSFQARFPFSTVKLSDPDMPVIVELTGWSPFTPGDADASSLPVAALEYRICNKTNKPQKGVFSYHASNILKHNEKSGASVQSMNNGFILCQPATEEKPAEQTDLAFFVTEAADVDCAWFRGGWFDPLTMIWNTVMAGKTKSQKPHQEGNPGNGGSLYVPFSLKPKAEKTIRLLLAWYVPKSALRNGADIPAAEANACGADCACNQAPATHAPWYAGRFPSINDVTAHWLNNYNSLRERSQQFSDCFYDTTLPPEVIEAVAANLTILKSPTCLRQADGRFWAWEGCGDNNGCCTGSCTHVWNYAQAMPHLFPALERTMRETEFGPAQDERGHQNFRASLPIRPSEHKFHAAADGQLGGIIKAYREWRICGDAGWLETLWPQIRQSLDFCIATWDPDHTGTLVEPHHNTYDIEFWGANGMCTSFYISALAAAIAMGQACQADVSLYEGLLAKGKKAMEKDLWNGEYFNQKVQWKGLRAGDPTKQQSWNVNYTPEASAIVEKEGPKYQYGNGCLSDGVLGDWMARCSGVPAVLDPVKTARHLKSIFKYNYRSSLENHSNPQRPSYAIGAEGGLLLCSWPHGGKPSLPFVYSDEVWTGIEYQVAAHLMMMGCVSEGLQIVRTLRDRYDGTVRNPFNEYECGHWYARAMSSYALLQGMTGARYDAVSQTLHLQPKVAGDFRAFIATATGYGTVGVRRGKPFIEVAAGTIKVQTFAYHPCSAKVKASKSPKAKSRSK